MQHKLFLTMFNEHYRKNYLEESNLRDTSVCSGHFISLLRRIFRHMNINYVRRRNILKFYVPKKPPVGMTCSWIPLLLATVKFRFVLHFFQPYSPIKILLNTYMMMIYPTSFLAHMKIEKVGKIEFWKCWSHLGFRI